MIDFYNKQCSDFGEWARGKEIQRDDDAMEEFVAQHNDPNKISWTRSLKADLRKNKPATFSANHIVTTMYRPFFKQNLYFDRQMNEMVYQIPKIFPTPKVKNLVISVNAGDKSRPFGALIVDLIPQLTVHGAGSPGQGFPLYVYEVADSKGDLFDDDITDGYRRRDAITDHTLNKYHNQYGSDLAKEDIFYFVYGLLHSREYIERYQADLSKMIPRIPLIKDFWGFSKAGRDLAQWHLNYETIAPWELEGLPPTGVSPASLRVEKMRFAKGASDHGKSAIVINSHYTLSGIPEEAYRYTVNGKSAIEWLIDRYQVKVEKDSQIRNDPNLYSDDPRYIIDLVARMVRVSMESVAIIDGLPKLQIVEEDQAN
jgi:predicted helicase